MANGYQQSFLTSMADLLISNKYTDMMTLSKTDGFKVHRAIVCPQSGVLASQVDTLLPDSAPIINCQEYDAETVGRMVDFLYTQDYDPFLIPRDAAFIKARFRANGLGQQGSSDEGEDDGQALTVTKDDLIAHIFVHGIATDYDVTLLKSLATEKFKTALEITPWNLKLYIELVNHIYQQPAEQSSKLRSQIMEFASDHVAELENSQSYKNAIQRLETIKVFSEDLVPHVRGEMARGALRRLFAKLRQTRRDGEGEKKSQGDDEDRKQSGENTATESTEDEQDKQGQDNAEGQEGGLKQQQQKEQAQGGDEVSQEKTLREQLLDAIQEGREGQQQRDEEVDEEEDQGEEDQSEENQSKEDPDDEDEGEEKKAQEHDEKSQSEDVDSQENGKERRKGDEEHQKGDNENQKGSEKAQQADQPSQDEAKNPGEDGKDQNNEEVQNSDEEHREAREEFKNVSEISSEEGPKTNGRNPKGVDDIPIIDLTSDDP